jgi:hypothetical protein
LLIVTYRVGLPYRFEGNTMMQYEGLWGVRDIINWWSESVADREDALLSQAEEADEEDVDDNEEEDDSEGQDVEEDDQADLVVARSKVAIDPESRDEL